MKKQIAMLAAITVGVTSLLTYQPMHARADEPVATATTEGKQTYTGSCGENASWTYDENSRTLIISGTGSVEDYQKLFGPGKLAEWNDIPLFAPIHVVVEDGITSLGRGFGENCFGYYTFDVSVQKTLEVAESVQEMDVAYLLGQKTVNFCGKVNSEFYNQTYRTNRFIDIETGELHPIPTSGTYTGGASWRYDTDSKCLYIDGNSTIAVKEINTDFGVLGTAKSIVIGKNVKLPESDSANNNSSILELLLATSNESQVYLYRDSEFGKGYENLIASNVNDGLTEDAARQMHNALYLDEAMVGDADLDGRITLMDAVLLSKAVNGSVAISDAQKISMDCDGDGDITANDTTALMQFLVHLVDTLPLK